jgi:hypothetical protein
MHGNKLLLAMAFVAADFGQAGAEIISVSGPASSLGAAPIIITAPSDLLDSCATGNGQIGFNEVQGLFTPLAFQADDGVIIPKDTLIDSHMIFFNHADSTAASHHDVVWTFKRPIIAVMSSSDGALEAASSFALGAHSTNHTASPSPNAAKCTGAAPFSSRGLESTSSTAPYGHTSCPSSDDCYTVSGNTIKVNMSISQPGDWMRVITQGAFKIVITIQHGGASTCISPTGHGVIPVTILGSAAFDVTQIDQSSLNLEGLSVRPKSNGKRQCALSDLNGDGFEDMVCQFQEDAKSWKGAAGVASVTGALFDGNLFEGSDSNCLIP